MTRCSCWPVNMEAWSAVPPGFQGVARPVEGDRGHGDDGSLSQPILQFLVDRGAVSVAKCVAVMVDDDVDEVGVVECRSGALEDVDRRTPTEVTTESIASGTGRLGSLSGRNVRARFGIGADTKRHVRHPVSAAAAAGRY